MISALLLGREGSVGFPDKNVYPLLGRPMMVYPLLAALHCPLIDEVYLSTDSERMKEIALNNLIKVIDRPPELCTNQALSEDAWVHGYQWIKEQSAQEIEMMVLLFCNAPTISSELLTEGIERLRSDNTLDSAATVSEYNMFSPVRARKVNSEGILESFIPLDILENLGKVDSDRKAMGDVLFADCSGFVVRPHCLENIHEGLPPQKWMGKRIAPIKNWGGLDIDYEWGVALAEHWLKKHGFTSEKTPYDK
ncbi:MAG: cytidylyltransferase domain-containing protein [Candidatus Xenobiia bacterium LiM19]